MDELEKVKQELIDEIKTYQIGMSEAFVRKIPKLVKCKGFGQKDLDDISEILKNFNDELNKRMMVEIMYRMLFK